MQAGTCLLPRMNCDAALMWHLPPPNRSTSFKVSTIFPLPEVEDTFPSAKGQNTMSRN